MNFTGVMLEHFTLFKAKRVFSFSLSVRLQLSHVVNTVNKLCEQTRIIIYE